MTAGSLKSQGPAQWSEVNVADRLAHIAARMPGAVAVATPGGGELAGDRGYATCSFAELDADATDLARGLIEQGVEPGERLALLVPPGIEFVKLVFALLRIGATTVLVDPGMGRRHLVNCLAATEPDGFVAVPRAQAVRSVLRRRFPNAQLNVTVGRRWFWGGVTFEQLLQLGRRSSAPLPATAADAAAAIIFTSGSTGPPKGVLYTHRMFDAQAESIQRAYSLAPGGADLACFALFGLFNSAMGVTTVFPQMNFSRPATADPRLLLAAANDWRVTQAFASPAVWDKLSRHGAQTGERIPTLRSVFSCGAPVPAAVLKRTLAMVHSEARMHTPYGATEGLPVATIEAAEVLGETATVTAAGGGVCVGRKFESIEWRVIRISDEPIGTLHAADELPAGEIGELIVRGPQVSPAYVVNAGANVSAKIHDGDNGWHRMGDVGYFDEQQRFWYCGRKAQRVVTVRGTLFTECCEAVFNEHPAVRRSALVGIPCAGARLPVVVVEVEAERRRECARNDAWQALVEELRNLAAQHEPTRTILCFLKHDSLPVDVRHNSKINREELATWAAKEMADSDLSHVMAMQCDAPKDSNSTEAVAPTELGRG